MQENDGLFRAGLPCNLDPFSEGNETAQKNYAKIRGQASDRGSALAAKGIVMYVSATALAAGTAGLAPVFAIFQAHKCGQKCMICY